MRVKNCSWRSSQPETAAKRYGTSRKQPACRTSASTRSTRNTAHPTIPNSRTGKEAKCLAV